MALAVGALAAGAARGAFSVAGVSEGDGATVGEAFAGVDFSDWERRVAADAEGLLAAANRVPPMPRGTVAFVSQGVGALPGAFVACTNAVPPEVLGAVPFWRVRVGNASGQKAGNSEQCARQAGDGVAVGGRMGVGFGVGLWVGRRIGGAEDWFEHGTA